MPHESIRLTNDIFLEVYGGEGGLDLQLRNRQPSRKNAYVSLQTWVPGHTFLDGVRFHIHLGDKVVYLNLDLIAENPRYIFALFHEMGHAVNLTRRGKLYELALRIGSGGWGGIRGARLRLSEERHAWAVGLRIARQLRDAGFDLFPLFRNKDRLSRWLRLRGLRSYERSFARRAAEREGSHIFGIQARMPKKSVRKKKYS